MTTKLVRHGDGYAVVIDRPTLEEWGVDEGTPLDVRAVGSGLLVSPVRDGERRRKLDEILAGINRRYGPALKRLAE
jgi:antitoxin component of MazEF toxin-antitoxin module